MNHVYRVVFNKALGVYQCVSELAKSNGKSSNRTTVGHRSGVVLSALSVAMLGMSAISAQAMIYSTSATLDNHYVVINEDIIEGATTVVSSTNLTVAKTGTASLIIQEGGKLDNSETVIIGEEIGSSGVVTVTGSGSVLDTIRLAVGASGTGKATLEDQGKINATFTAIGLNTGSTGTLTVKGNGSVLDTESLTVGSFGTGDVIIEEQGTIITKFTILGSDGGYNYPLSKGTLTVKGENSILDTEELRIGVFGTGDVIVEDQGSINVTGYTTIGAADKQGTLTVRGDGSTFNTNAFEIGFNSTGIVTVEDQGTISTGYTIIAANAGSEGMITVTGEGSRLESTDYIYFVNGSSGRLDIKDNGRVSTKAITSHPQASATINFDNGFLVINPTVQNPDQPPLLSPYLFAGFEADDSINLAAASDTSIGGGTIDIQGERTFVTVAPDAVIKGGGDFTKTGTGGLSMKADSKQWTGATNINQGILEIDGNYTMRDGEVLAIGLNSADDYGQLFIRGSGDISQGLLKVNASDAVIKLSGGTVWDNVVSSEGITGEFANTDNIEDNSPLVSFAADYTGYSVDLKMIKAPTPPEPPVVVPPITPPVTPEPPVVVPPTNDTTFVRAVSEQGYLNDLGIAHVLDRAIDDRVNNGANALADALISDTINLKQPQLATAANQLQPLMIGATNRIITDSNYLAGEAINTHSTVRPKRSLWAKAIGNTGSHDLENGVTGYDADSYGAVAGLDIPMNQDLNLGVAVSYMDTDIDSNGRLDHQADVKSWQVLGYGRYAANDNTFVNFHAGAGRSDVEGERRIPILTDAIAQSDYNVDTLQASLGIHHRIVSAERHISPFTQFSYAQAESDSYHENGAGVYNLNVEENKYQSLRWSAGINLSQALTDKLAITGQLAGAIENGDQHSDITASFVGSNDSFKTIGQDIGQEIGIVGIGISYMPTARTTLSAGYRGEWRENYDDQGANVAVQMTF